MCQTTPGKIESIKDGRAVIQGGAGKAYIDLGLVSGAKKGDWVLYTANMAVKLISEEEAEEILDLLKD